jgi:hypothetical protein
LLTWNRHYRAKIIISSQYLNHLLPESRKQIDVWMLFKGHPEKKLEEIYNDADISIPFDDFLALYKKATKHKFSFLYINTRGDEFRRNFNEQFVFHEPESEEDDY